MGIFHRIEQLDKHCLVRGRKSALHDNVDAERAAEYNRVVDLEAAFLDPAEYGVPRVCVSSDGNIGHICICQV
jgi:hypothetical protein